MSEPVLAFADVMRQLRAQCPWKASQTHRSLVRYLLEETHETVEAIETGDAAHLREELGDLLLQVFLHTAIAEQAGEFTLDDVAREVIAKMVRRNPHVLGDDAGSAGEGASSLSPREVDDAWQAIKAQEKARSSVSDGLAPSLPALLLADKVLDRLSRLAPPAEVAVVAGRGGSSRAPATDDAAATEEQIGERLLGLVAEARAAGVDPEQALRGAVRRVAAGR